MPLNHGYGLVIGTKFDYFRDPPDNFGRFYHGNLIVSAPAGTNPAGKYKCAIDVDPKNMPDGIEWRVAKIRASDFAPIKALADGWHPLVSNPTSGALDYIRSAVLHPPVVFRRVRYRGLVFNLLHTVRWNPPWNHGTGIDALVDLEAVLAQGTRFYVFGEPFNTGLGVHNIHQNQGDPIGSGFELENAIWQDGATIVETAQGTFVGFLNKFKTQSFNTDDQGRPL